MTKIHGTCRNGKKTKDGSEVGFTLAIDFATNLVVPSKGNQCIVFNEYEIQMQHPEAFANSCIKTDQVSVFH